MECPTDLTVVLVKYIYRLTEASCLGYEEMHKPGRGGTPLYKPYRYVPHHRVGFLRPFCLKTGMHLAHFGLESGMVFEGTTDQYI